MADITPSIISEARRSPEGAKRALRLAAQEMDRGNALHPELRDWLVAALRKAGNGEDPAVAFGLRHSRGRPATGDREGQSSRKNIAVGEAMLRLVDGGMSETRAKKQVSAELHVSAASALRALRMLQDVREIEASYETGDN